MLDIFLRIIDVVMPPPTCVLKLRSETPEKFVRFYKLSRISNSLCLSNYSEANIRHAVTANKFHNHQKSGKLLASLVENWLEQQAEEGFIFVPIPLSRKRQKERGYNQCTRIIENIKRDNVTVQNLLIKTKHTAPQTKLDRSMRFQNIADAFAYQAPSKELDLQNKHIILLDDVVTTGATMKSAYKTLKQNLPKGCKVTCLALAH